MPHKFYGRFYHDARTIRQIFLVWMHACAHVCMHIIMSFICHMYTETEESSLHYDAQTIGQIFLIILQCVCMYAYYQSHIYVTCIYKKRKGTSRQVPHMFDDYIFMSYTCYTYCDTEESIRKITSRQVPHMFDGRFRHDTRTVG